MSPLTIIVLYETRSCPSYLDSWYRSRLPRPDAATHIRKREEVPVLLPPLGGLYSESREIGKEILRKYRRCREKGEQQVREIPEEIGIFRGTLDEKCLSIPILHAEHEKL